MTTHSNARERQQKSLVNNTSTTERSTTKTSISNSLKRRARSLTRDQSTDPGGRALIRYALLTSDPWLPELVRRANATEPIVNIRGLLGKPRP